MKRTLSRLTSLAALLIIALSFSAQVRAEEGTEGGDPVKDQKSSQHKAGTPGQAMSEAEQNLAARRAVYLQQAYNDCLQQAILNSAEMDQAKKECEDHTKNLAKQGFPLGNNPANPGDATKTYEHGIER